LKLIMTRPDLIEPSYNNYFTEMCSGFEAGSYLRLTDFVYHSTLGLRVIKKNKKDRARHWVREKIRERVLTIRHPYASERRGNNSKRFKDLYLKAKARIWP